MAWCHICCSQFSTPHPGLTFSSELVSAVMRVSITRTFHFSLQLYSERLSPRHPSVSLTHYVYTERMGTIQHTVPQVVAIKQSRSSHRLQLTPVCQDSGVQRDSRRYALGRCARHVSLRESSAACTPASCLRSPALGVACLVVVAAALPLGARYCTVSQ